MCEIEIVIEIECLWVGGKSKIKGRGEANLLKGRDNEIR